MSIHNLQMLLCLILMSPITGQKVRSQQSGISLSGKWDTSPANMLLPRKNHSSCIVDGKIYIFGGYINSSLKLAPPEVHIYDPEKDEWELREISKQFQRSGMKTISVGDKIYVLGGKITYPETDNAFLYFAVDVYDPKKNSWQSRTNFPGTWMGPGCVIDRMIYVIGGAQGSSDGRGPDKVAYKYNTETDVWSRIADLSVPRYSMEIIAYDGKVFAIGGISQESLESTPGWYDDGCRNVEIYDPVSDSWSPGPTLPVTMARMFNTCVSGDELIIIGGYKSLHAHETLDAMYMLNTEKQEWELFDKLPVPNGFHTVERIGNEIYLFGGGSFYGEIRKRVWVYNLNPGRMVANENTEYKLFPNPAGNHTRFRVSTNRPEEFQIEIRNFMGQTVKQVFNASLPAGEHEVPIDLSDLDPGIYYVNLIADEITSQLMIKE